MTLQPTHFRPILLTFAMALAALAFAQNPSSAEQARSRAYHQYRLTMTSPPYGLRTVDSLVAKIVVDPNGPGDAPLGSTVFASLPFDEKFTYVMIHREQVNQNCNPMPEMAEEETKIFGELPDPDDQMAWSDREIAFLKNNRSRIVGLLRKEIRSHPHVGLNTKMGVVLLDADSLIPDLVRAFNRNPKDLDVLTTLMILMKDGHYQPFLKSISYRKLYGPSSSYQSFVEGTTANQKLTMQRAISFYRNLG